MKTYVTMLIPVVVLAIVLAGGLFIVPALDSPRSQLDRTVDEKIELAQRMLQQYNPASPRLQQVFERPGTQPAEVPDDKWRTYLDLEENTPFASLRERLLGQEQELRKLSDQLATMGGSPSAAAGPGSPDAAYQGLIDELKAAKGVLDQALRITRDAISTEFGEGESQASGRSHPNATRLEAILLHHQADLLRREAALVRAKAGLDRGRVARLALVSREVQDRIAAEKLLVAGGTAPGKPVQPAVAPQPAPAAAPAAPQPATEQPAAEDSAVEKPAKSGNWWIFDGLAQRVPRKPKAAPAPEQPKAEPKPEPIAETPAQPEVPQGPAEVVPPLPERIAALQKNRVDVEERIKSDQARIDELSKAITDVEARLAAAKQKAAEAELKMLEAEQQGVKSTDPEAVQAYINEYRKLAEVQREAGREAATLQDGSLRNGRAASSDPEEILAGPVVPVDAAKPIEPERGLTALMNDKLIAETTLKANQGLLAEVDRQIKTLSSRRESVEARLAKLQAEAQELASQLSKYAAAASSEMMQADELEKEAMASIASGQAAASQAESAARDYQTRLAAFIRSENPTDAPVRKLTDMAGDQFTSAHALAVKGDLHYLLARVYTQQAADLELQRKMLVSLAGLGVTVKLDKPRAEGEAPAAEPASAEQSGAENAAEQPAASAPAAEPSAEGAAEQPAETPPAEEPSPQDVEIDMAAAVTSADAAAKAIAQLRKKAVDEAKQALEQYTQAASQAKDLWVVHTQIAAVHNMLADLPRAEGDTEDHLALAKQTYTRALQGRERRPEYAAYRRIAESLKEPPKEQ